MIRYLIAAILVGSAVGCGGATSQPPSGKQVVTMCKERLEKDYHIQHIQAFADDVTSEREDGLWTIRGSTVQPSGDFHCTINAKDGTIAVAAFARY